MTPEERRRQSPYVSTAGKANSCLVLLLLSQGKKMSPRDGRSIFERSFTVVECGLAAMQSVAAAAIVKCGKREKGRYQKLFPRCHF